MRALKTYSELMKRETFLERYRYLRLGGKVGEQTFGFERYLNQVFYQTDKEWKDIREDIIIRDLGCDLAIEGRDIFEKVYVHHIIPLTRDDLIRRTKYLLDPEFLISTSKNTHDAIHYGSENILLLDPIVRRPNDTCPWKR